MEKCVLRWHKGSIIELHLDGYYAYGQLLRPYHVGFYDKKFDSPITDVKQLKGIPFLFIQLIYPTAVYDGLWKTVGQLPVKEENETLPMKFMYDEIGDRYFLVNPNNGEMKRCAKEDIPYGMEEATVFWENHIEDRLNAYFLGTHDCQWMKHIYDLFGRYVP